MGIFVLSYQMLMFAGNKIACMNVLSSTEKDDDTQLRKMYYKLKTKASKQTKKSNNKPKYFNVIFTVPLLFVSLLCFSVLQCNLLKLENYFS